MRAENCWNRVLSLMTVFVALYGCNPKQEVVNIHDSSSLKIVGEYGQMDIVFDEKSMNPSKVTVNDKSGNLIFDQTIEGDGVVSGRRVFQEGDSTVLKRFRSYFVDKNKRVLNDSLVEWESNMLLTTRELKVDGRLLYLESLQDNVKRYNTVNMRLVDYEMLEGHKFKLLLKNYFPFNGEFEFYYPDTKDKLTSKKIESNFYLVEYVWDPR